MSDERPIPPPPWGGLHFAGWNERGEAKWSSIPCPRVDDDTEARRFEALIDAGTQKRIHSSSGTKET
jgi:hypothetical protein